MKKILSLILVLVILLSISITNVFAEVTYTGNVIPVMTSNTTPSGEASAINTNGDREPYRAFDGKNTSYMTDAWVAEDGYPGSLIYDFGVNNSKVIGKYSLAASDLYSKMIRKWTLYGSNDKTNWVTLDNRSNIIYTTAFEVKDFTFDNSTAYRYYKLYCQDTDFLKIIGEMQMMEVVASAPINAPTNLIAVAGIEKVDLHWDAITDATGYNVKRAEVAGGPYTAIATNIIATSYTDSPLTSGKTYYYVITALNANGESANSNEAFAVPQTPVFNSGILEIKMIDGSIKEYDLTGTELNAFITWYEGRADGVGKAYYVMYKKSNIKPFITRREYIAFDKIVSFEVKEYAN